MTDVRLTATNPDDSSVVPVACNAKGELKLEEPIDNSFDGNLDGDLTVSGSAEFAGDIESATNVFVGDYDLTSTTSDGVRLQPGILKVQRPSTIPDSASALEIHRGTQQVFGLLADGSASFAGDITADGNTASLRFYALGDSITDRFRGYSPTSDGTKLTFRVDSNGTVKIAADDTPGNNPKITLASDGSASFAGDVTVGSRNKKWMLVEQGGLCHMVEQTRRSPDVSTADLVEPQQEYPKLRDVLNELDLVEQALQAVMEKLRMDPPAGWPVWDGSA